MVCKDDVFLWFKNLEAWKRIDVICGLLNMFCSFELRYFNSYLENLYNKPDFLLMDDLQKKANNPEEISKLKSFENTSVRSRLVVYLTFLQSKNQECSNIIFDYVNKYLNIKALKEMGILANKELEEEVLLLLKLAINHPAFSFTQIHDLNELFENIQNFISIEKKNSGIILNYSQSTESLRPSYFDELNTNVNLINSLVKIPITCLKATPLHNSSNFSFCQISVEWNDGKNYQIIKIPNQLLHFHQQLSHHFKEAIATSGIENYLDDSLKECLHNDYFDLKVCEKVNAYLKSLLYLPSYILESKIFTQFFELNEPVPRSQEPKEPAKTFPQANQHEVKSCTFYNSLITSCKEFDKSQTKPNHPGTLPQTPLLSSNSLDSNIQISEEVNWLHDQLAEYSNKFKEISSLKELYSLNPEELASMGLDQHASGKILSIIEGSRLKFETNSIPKHISSSTKMASFLKPTIKTNGSNESLDSEVSSSTSQSSEEERICFTSNKASTINTSVPSLVTPYNFIHPMFLKQNLLGGSKYIHNNPPIIDHTGSWNYHPPPPTMPLCYHQATIPPPVEMPNTAAPFTNTANSTSSNLGAKEKTPANSYNYQGPNIPPCQCVCNAPSPYYSYISVNLHPQHFPPNYPGYPQIPMEMFYAQHPPPHIPLGTSPNPCPSGVNSSPSPSNSNMATPGSPLSPSVTPPASVSASTSNGTQKSVCRFNCGKNSHSGCDCADSHFDTTQACFPNSNGTSYFDPKPKE